MRSIGLKTLLGATALSLAVATPALADGLSGTAAATTNYLFRGITQTLDKPTVQASIGYDFGNGFSASVWGSGIDFGDGKSSLETDYSATYTTSWNDFDFSVGGIYYAYHTSPSAFKYNYFEGWVGVSHDFGPFSANASVFYSPEFFGVTKAGWYASIGAGVPITDWLSASANYGYQTVDSPGYFITKDSYSNWNLGLTATYKAFSLNAMYSQTDLPDTGGLQDAKFVVTLGASF